MKYPYLSTYFNEKSILKDKFYCVRYTHTHRLIPSFPQFTHMAKEVVQEDKGQNLCTRRDSNPQRRFRRPA